MTEALNFAIYNPSLKKLEIILQFELRQVRALKDAKILKPGSASSVEEHLRDKVWSRQTMDRISLYTKSFSFLINSQNWGFEISWRESRNIAIGIENYCC